MRRFFLSKNWPVLLTAAGLAALLALLLAPYNFNPSALFHLDVQTHESFNVPEGFTVLTVPAYDGAHYYQIARLIPKLIDPTQWEYVSSLTTASYAYQRFLLPLLSFLLSFGQTAALPYTFLLINVLSLIGACAVFLRWKQKPLYALALAFSPAAMVGLHFSLAEPLTLLLLSIFLTRYIERKEFTWLDVLLLCLLTLTREVNILFVGFLGLFTIYKRQWKNMFLLLFPVATFLALHGFIHLVFGDWPFFTSTSKSTLPFEAIIDLLLGGQGYNMFTFSSIPLFLCVVLPALLWILWLILKKGERSVEALGALAFLGVMIMMPDYIWGSITSIGRVITPVYVLLLALAAQRDSLPARGIALMILCIGVGAALGLALITHPFILA